MIPPKKVTINRSWSLSDCAPFPCGSRISSHVLRADKRWQFWNKIDLDWFGKQTKSNDVNSRRILENRFGRLVLFLLWTLQLLPLRLRSRPSNKLVHDIRPYWRLIQHVVRVDLCLAHLEGWLWTQLTVYQVLWNSSPDTQKTSRPITSNH